MITLDASTLIAHLDASDAHHERATALLLHRAPEGGWVHNLTMAEVLVGPARAGQAEAVLAVLGRLGVQVAPAPGQPIDLAKLRATTGLRLPDCCVLDTSLRTRTALATFDRRLARQAATLGVELVDSTG